MCKTKKVFFIDSNNRNASSTSETDFKIDLDHPLILPDGCGVAIDSLSLPNTSNIDSVVPGINDKLYTSLNDGTTTTYQALTLPAVGYDNVATLATELQTVLASAYAGVAGSITGAEGNWTNANNVTLVSGFTYTNGSNTFEFTEWDASAETGKVIRGLSNGNTQMYSYVKTGSTQQLTPDSGTGSIFTLPSTFAFVGSYPAPSSLVNATSAGDVLTITPINPQDEFIIYTDFDLRNDYQGVDVAANFGANKSNLQSANKYIQNLGNSSSVYTVASPFQREINVNLPAFNSILSGRT